MVLPNNTSSEASVIDIVSFGYRRAIQNFWSSTKLAIPTIISAAIIGFIQAYLAGVPKTDPRQIAALPTLLLFLVNGFNAYAVMIYTRDLYFGEAKESSLHYWKQDRIFKKLFLLSLLYMLLAIPVFIIGGIGLLLLVAPGVMWFSYVFTAYNLISAIVVDKPDLGVFGSIKEGFRLLKNNMLRTIGLGLSSLVISIIITLPLSLINGMIGVYLRKAPASASSIGLFVLSAGIHSALSWFSLTVGLCGTVLIMYRYIQDLKARHGEIDESNYNHEPSNLPPGMFGVKR